ncbi:hypothetical protein BN434_0385 [Erwinia amylovora CFBP 2585]|uniref:Uncharacterized protein n=3 Tax=Erwinia amylovora TaxID=552 RepID=A0A831ENU9_ERWAM|nr:hypothetical protein predicted by Glimmer/Critica [Erwinia amylovora CFBP1430]CBX79185.1 hypothetical protein predicted by Glimmer/Critica [Erwinia amylovora ATCC BAA-2158]CCO77221.1 hypothetical protein BN432_0388 [Erwinia amylovora Ea356]CCO81004.1 hypothetical protein BN433_0397 [Erwinia amylovora Ea266]CCO84808.1 hypothetical protein BN434_0385 [Erwinia amylovora CFBP 2585]CCO92351.1 hypothetical protein BN437_0385 [Erwinia amylovora NBRC 12687 = CFBP 1232]
MMCFCGGDDETGIAMGKTAVPDSEGFVACAR